MTATDLRTQAEGLAAALPALLAEAKRLATTVMWGEHGRRRAGPGEEFWQYRHATPSDGARAIDWRRSARDDGGTFVREREWQAAQTVNIWVDPATSMQFSSGPNTPFKSGRANVLGLAVADLLLRGGERVGLLNAGAPVRGGRANLDRLAMGLLHQNPTPDGGAPSLENLPARSSVVLFSDFFADLDTLAVEVQNAAGKGISGHLVQILDPTEETFPFDGRTRFTSMGGELEFETQKAGALRARYLERLADRKDQLRSLARQTGWQFFTHHTDAQPLDVLLQIYQAMEGSK